ncbi:MAG: hypothetical protein K1X78_22655 [Verrucomicrobiaceae bacterium]|nr:hypothetical protein [Verrucomicrobiaceae bacterium]
MSVVPNTKRPASRKLRGYAFDPSLSLQLDTVTINEIVYKVPWEELEPGKVAGQGPGPAGEYVEVVDYDPTVKKLYAPVDLNERLTLAMDGLDPSEANPQFHQQMVYAVAMTTIRNFEAALGRKVIWAPRRLSGGGEEYVQRLRIYPHALREANAYYSPQKKALLFGYFQAMPADKTRHMPDALVFTCLSHDIIAHETTHAILDGMYPYYNEPTNPDVLAFHEAFADIVALFQHFTFPEVLKHQIAKTRGNLEGQNLLGQLAQEFGSAMGCYGSLRDAIGHIDPKTKQWRPTEPDPGDYESTMEPHARGSILVAAVFEAFLSMYKHEVADLLRIASDGSGNLQAGELLPDLVHRLAAEASRCSQRVLNMCIRALDYCPPVDLTFGDFLRGIITADIDLKGEAQHEFRLAFIDAFRRRGIYPKGIKVLSVDSIAHTRSPEIGPQIGQLIGIIAEFLRDFRSEVSYCMDRQQMFDISRCFSGGRSKLNGKSILGLHARMLAKFDGSYDFQRLTRLAWADWGNVGVADSRDEYGPRFAVQNLRLVSRAAPNGDQVNNIVFSIVQRAGVKIKNGTIEPHVLKDGEADDDDSMIFRGGCTFVFDLDTLDLKYVISKPLLGPQPESGRHAPQLDEDRVRAQYEYQFETGPNAMSEFRQYFDTGFARGLPEPFALLHQH